MERVDSLDISYKKLNMMNCVKNYSMIASFALSILGYWFSQNSWFVAVSVIIIIIYFLSSITSEVYSNVLGNRRLVNTVEDGYGKRISTAVYTKNYYNNSQPEGVDKFNLDIFESVFFTYHIFNRQSARIYVVSILCFIGSVFAITFTNPVFSLLVLDIIFSGDMVVKLIKTVYFHLILAAIYGDYDRIYVARQQLDSRHYLLALSIKYERMKAYYSLALDSKLFNEMNSKLSQQWGTYVTKYVIPEMEQVSPNADTIVK